MSEERFKELVDEILNNVENLLLVKGIEYRRDNNPFHNFEKGSEITGQTPYRVLNGFLLKHLISYNDILNDIEKGVIPSQKIVDEKLQDIITYFVLQKVQLSQLYDR
jgi:hypothetical protein